MRGSLHCASQRQERDASVEMTDVGCGKRSHYLALALFVDEVDGGFGGGAACWDGRSVEGRWRQDYVWVVGEAEAFLGDAEHVFIELVVGVFVMQGDERVAAGRDLQGDSG